MLKPAHLLLSSAAGLLAALLTSCGSGPTHPKSASGHAQPDPASADVNPWAKLDPQAMPWDSLPPLAFLDLLIQGEPTLFTVWNEPGPEWYDEVQLEGLIARLDSQRHATSVVSARSSVLPIGSTSDDTLGWQGSTEAREVAFLIQGYRQGRYPPTLGSLPYFTPDIEEILSWWGRR